MFQTIKDGLYTALIEQSRYLLLLEGLRNTLIITLFSLLLGVAIGVVVAMAKIAAGSSKKMRPVGWLADIYLTVIRGTPVVVQLIIINGAVLAAVENKLLVAIVAFGVNSGAYVAEIIRGGILSINKGQTEAGRSLGLTSGQTMRLIVLPQAVKNVLPALGNEAIALLKETSVAGYVAIRDLTKAGDSIVSRTWSMAPMYIVAITYLVIVLIMTQLLRLLERRLSQGDRR